MTATRTAFLLAMSPRPRSPPAVTPRRSKRLRSTTARAAKAPPSPTSSSASAPSAADADFSPATPSSTPNSPASTTPPPTPPPRRQPRARLPKPALSAIKPSTSTSTTFTPPQLVSLRTALLKWYKANHRSLPWRAEPTYNNPSPCPDASALPHNAPGAPYAVWISEVMSQQTRLSVTVSYFERWMESFPTPSALALAPLEHVNTHWAGLGYYRRAKHLHEAAQAVVSRHNGRLPTTLADLQALPGVGRYTAAAIASISFGIRAGLVDGNVQRVLARLLPALTAPPSVLSEKPRLPNAYWELAQMLIEECEHPADLNQALMELGATVCTPRAPRCQECPVRAECGAWDEAFAAGIDDVPQFVTRYPAKSVKKAVKVRDEAVAVVVLCLCTHKGHKFWLQQRRGDGLLAGLWEAPNTVVNDAVDAAADKVEKDLLGLFGDSASVRFKVEVGEVRHVFSHIRQTLHIRLLVIHGKNDETALSQDGVTNLDTPFRWMSRAEIGCAAVSTQMKKVFAAAFRKLPNATRLR